MHDAKRRIVCDEDFRFNRTFCYGGAFKSGARRIAATRADATF
jgi:hypothetical protein